MNNEQEKVVLKVEDLAISFHTDKGRVKAVRGVSFELYKGEVLCIVGESGSGKSVTAKTIMGILPGNGRIDAGHIYYEGEDLTRVSEEEFHRIRGKKIGMIFQDPLSSLNPIMKVGKQITEAMIINNDKLKKMFLELITEEQSAYNNETHQRHQAINDLKEAIVLHKKEMKAERKVIRKNKELGFKKKWELIFADFKKYFAFKAECKQQIKNIKAEYGPKIAELKQKLDERKKVAKAEVHDFHQKIKDERDEAIKELEAKLAANPSEKAAINAEIKQVKTDYVNKTKITRAEAKKRAYRVMEEVGIPQPVRRFKQYPFEFSGGMRQRIVIAIALTQDPDVLICDEPTTALDVTIQAQILELIQRLTIERELTVMFITHDLGVVANMADRVAVMYAGKIVEIGTSHDVFYDPRHPYTWALLSSIPDVDSNERLEAIPGTPPNMIYPPKGDAFAPRSKYAMAVDYKEEPPMFKVSETHYAATWLLDERAPKAVMPKIVSERIKNSLKKAGEIDG